MRPYRHLGDPRRPSPDRNDTLAGCALFFGCVFILVAALVWGVANVWPPAPAVAVWWAGVGTLLLCAAVNRARRAGYEARRQHEWDRRYWGRR